MCFIRVNTTHQPIKPPGAAPTLTNVYDKNILETSIDIANPTSHEIVASLAVNEKLQVEHGHDGQSQPIRKVTKEELTEKRKGKRTESVPNDRKGSSSSKVDGRRARKGNEATSEPEKERQRV